MFSKRLRPRTHRQRAPLLGRRVRVATTLVVAFAISETVARAQGPFQDPSRVLEALRRDASQKVPLQEYTQEQLAQITPTSPNPYMSILPEGVVPDWNYWHSYMRIRAQQHADQERELPPEKIIDATESEPNDTQVTANHIPQLASSPLFGDPRAVIDATVSAPLPPTEFGPITEDDGSIPLANETDLQAGESVRIATEGIGDGPHGSFGTGFGDFDFYRIEDLHEDNIITVEVATAAPFADLDPFVAVWDEFGRLWDFNDDATVNTFDSFLVFKVVFPGDYYVSVGGFNSFIPDDPFDSSSGFSFGSEGEYTLTIGVDHLDFDFYSFDLIAGDLISAIINDFGVVSLIDPNGVELVGSRVDRSGAYPFESPLPRTGLSFAYTVPRAGRYAVRFFGSIPGDYTLTLDVFRPGLETAPTGTRQIVFLDFDGGSYNDRIFGGPGVIRTLSPLRNFLANWGLTLADESALIDEILAVVEENLVSDLQFPGGNNPNFGIEIRNSRDHADPFGEPNVSRVIIGGTIAEAQISTIGVAETIDPGNFSREDTAIMLLDTVSRPAGATSFSYNSYRLAPGFSKIDIVARGIGHTTSHEIGHYLGNWHTQNFDAKPTIMDRGGDMPNRLGAGPDAIFGSEDDVDADFASDSFTPFEAYTGFEHQRELTAFALTTGRGEPGEIPLKWPYVAAAMVLAAAYAFRKRLRS